jgi:hypothetical protein
MIWARDWFEAFFLKEIRFRVPQIECVPIISGDNIRLIIPNQCSHHPILGAARPAVLTLEEVVVEVHKASTLLPASDLKSWPVRARKGDSINKSWEVMKPSHSGHPLMDWWPSKLLSLGYQPRPKKWASLVTKTLHWRVTFNILTQVIRHVNVKWAIETSIYPLVI